MQEVAEFIQINNEKIFAVFHVPEKTDISKAFVFIHPFAEEKLWSHRVYVSFARELARQGYHVARFDFRGHGDSDGDFIDSSLEKHNKDIGTVINQLRVKFQVDDIGLFGLRLGATLAINYASSNNDIRDIILWDPVLKGERYMQELLRSNLAGQMALKGKVEVTRDDLVKQMRSGIPINIEGYFLTYSYYSELSEIDLQKLKDRKSINCLINQIVRNPKQPQNKTFLEFINKFSEKSELVKSHEEQFWKEIKTFYQTAENLCSSTLSWMNKLK
ncbi:MAG: alpha/beta fold hydrolase [Candidatus Thiodiazotropha sp.]